MLKRRAESRKNEEEDRKTTGKPGLSAINPPRKGPKIQPMNPMCGISKFGSQFIFDVINRYSSG